MTDAIALSPREAAKAVGVGVDAIRTAYRSGALPAHYVGPQTVRILRTDLEAWVAGAPTERASA